MSSFKTMNQANGGALAVDSIDDVSLVNNTFVGNSSTQGDDLWATLSPAIINTIFTQSVVCVCVSC